MATNQTGATQGNILIIDDAPENLQLLSKTLSEQGYIVRGALKGQMGIKAAQSAPPDLILLDIKMPDIDGYEVCEIIKNDPNIKEIPVIFLSALDDVWDKVKAFQVGGIDYITKPFQVEEVLARVKNQLLIRNLNKQLQAQNQQLQQEIIERKKAEKAAEAASKAKSEFVANMSHELRTPLNAILGFTQILSRDQFLNVEHREYLEIINRSGEHLLELIDDVLELSKIESGRIFLNESSFDFYRFLDSLEEMFQIKAEQKGLYLTFRISSEVPQYIKTDQQKLRGCLINLLGNAIKFTQLGSVTLRVSVGMTQKQQTTDNRQQILHFEVEDTGSGIAEDEIDSIFKAFVQAEIGRRSSEGTGLGLAISQKFVQMMGGEITVSSTVGEGTTFRFDINIVPVDEFAITTKPRQRVIGLHPNQEAYRILVADDTRENRLLLVKLLEPLGFEVREAENGQEAVTQWLAFHPHLIWMDTRMPVMDGLEATREIRGRERGRVGDGENSSSISLGGGTNFHPLTESPPHQSPLPLIPSRDPEFPAPHTVIIALTASVFEERRPDIIAAGCDDFVRKPFTEEVIFEKIAQYLGTRYLYEDLPQSITATRRVNPVSEKSDSFFLERMAAMPSRWVVNLEQAAKNLDEELVLQLIEQIPDNNALLAEALKKIIYDFRLDVILRLTQLFLSS
jgi:signal transduction histidine kinase